MQLRICAALLTVILLIVLTSFTAFRRVDMDSLRKLVLS